MKMPTALAIAALIRRRHFSLVGLLLLCLSEASAYGQGARLPDVAYMDQPTGIDPSACLAAWPALAPYIVRLKDSRSVESDLRARSSSSDVTDGELNLLAQLQWQHGERDAADEAIARAVALKPTQALNWFQEAMVDFAHWRRASGIFERWKWQRRTRDAYERTFELDPHNSSARYYLAYTYMNTPAIGGGSLQRR